MQSIRPGRYRHFKGKEYQVLSIARHSETQEPMVVYQALYGERGIWVRPAAMWTEWVERDGYSGPRFTYLGEEALVLEPVSPASRPLLWNLLQAYLAELSAYAPAPEPDPSGVYPYPYFDAYFTAQDRTALLLRVEGSPAGFALVNAVSALGEPIDQAVRLFAARPGRWEIKYHQANHAAQVLWTRCAAPYAPTLRALGPEQILTFTV